MKNVFLPSGYQYVMKANSCHPICKSTAAHRTIKDRMILYIQITYTDIEPATINSNN